MLKEFRYEFEDESENSVISFEYDEKTEEKFVVKIESGVPVIYGNKASFGLLARTFSKLALGNYKEGFHLHLRSDFDADEPEALRIVVNDD